MLGQGAHAQLPSYNTHARWSLEANKARRLHDYATAVLAAGGSAIGLAAAWALYPYRLLAQPATLWLSVAVSAASVLVILLGPRWHFTPAAQQD